jgi:hypothetical protein
MTWTEQLYNAVKVFEPLRDDAIIEKVWQGALWPESVFVRESPIGAFEMGFKNFARATQEDLKNAAKGFNVKSIEDLHRNLNVKSKQNYNGNIGRSQRWHVAQTCGVIEDLDRKQVDPTAEQIRNATKTPLNNPSFKPFAREFSIGEDIHKDLLATKDLL